MNAVETLTTRDLAQRLSEAEATIEALLAGQVDAVVDPRSQTPVLVAKAQEAMRLSEERYRLIVETAGEGISIVEGDSTITFVNRQFADMLGYQPDELVGSSLLHIVAEAGRPAAALRMKHSREGLSETQEVAYLRKNGTELWTLLRTNPIRNAAGTWIGTLAMTTDRTRQRQDEEALRRSTADLRTSEERMRFALEAAGIGIWDMDYASGTHRWSGILEAQYGLKPRTFGGTFEAFFALIHPDDRESVHAAVAKAMKLGSDFSVQNRRICPDGEVRWLEGRGRVVLGDDGQPVRAVGISLDVTQRHALEEQFQQAQKMEAVGRLAGGVAHDFNNLLTVILGFCELLLADHDPADPRHADIAEIQKAGARAAGLTRQLLAFSRKQIIEPMLIDLSAVIADMRPMLVRLIGEDVTVVFNLPPAAAPIKADRGQVEQIVMNLALNARDAMPNGGTLTIAVASLDLDEHYAKMHLSVQAGPHVALLVTDTGSGLTPQVRERLFEPFFTTKEPGKGTGLGLATVHGIVKASGGAIDVDTELGRGTAFRVYFPRGPAAGAAVAPPPPDVRTRTARRTVLVVEDEESLRAVIKRMLRQQGYTALLAANADEALDRFERNPSIDVILSDVVMPGASGPELVKQLRERRPTLKVLYMSGYTDEAIIHHGVLNPGIAFLHKPFTSDALGRKLRQVLDTG